MIPLGLALLRSGGCFHLLSSCSLSAEGRTACDGLPDLMTSDGMFRLKMKVSLGTSVEGSTFGFPQIMA